MPSILQKFLDLHIGQAKTPGLASMLGLQNIGDNKPAPPPLAEVSGPVDEAALKAYLERMGPVYPTMPKINPEAWASALEAMPQSINIEDRRGLRKSR